MRTQTFSQPTMLDQEMAEAEFYSRKFFFSYSSMSLLMYSPAAFYGKYVMNLEEEDKIMKHLIEGKVIHCLLLDPDSFDDQFIVSLDKVPTGNIRKVLDLLFQSNLDVIYDDTDPRIEMEHFRQEIIEILKEINLYQSYVDDKATKKEPNPKTGDEKRIEKVITAENINYWEFMLKRGKSKKEIIDQATVDYCKNAAEIIRLTPGVMSLLGMDVTDLDKKEVFNETLFTTELSRYDWGLKGILDNLVIDHDERIIYINDLKTTSKSLADFKESVEFYRYWLQAVIYIILITSRYKHLIDKGYQLKFHFIVIDPNFQVYPFPVSNTSLQEWKVRAQEIFTKANHHYQNRRFELPYEFDLGLVAL